MKRLLCFFVFVAVALMSLDCFAGVKALFVYAPPPDVTKLRQYLRLHPGAKGSGVFLLHVDSKTGAVTSVEVQKSTGIAFLDEITIEAFRKWQAKPGTVPLVRVPMTYTDRHP
jgi:TonB family protein